MDASERNAVSLTAKAAQLLINSSNSKGLHCIRCLILAYTHTHTHTSCSSNTAAAAAAASSPVAHQVCHLLRPSPSVRPSRLLLPRSLGTRKAGRQTVTAAGASVRPSLPRCLRQSRSATRVSFAGQWLSSPSRFSWSDSPVTTCLPSRYSYLSRGFCRSGEECEFSHDPATGVQIPDNVCIFNLQAKCINGSCCRSVSPSLAPRPVSLTPA